MDLRGATVLLTGASSGIGAAAARLLAKRGATVGLVARRRDRLEEVLADCQENSPDSYLAVADLSDYERLLFETLLKLPNVSDVRSDFTETVYWHPVLVLPDSGKASVEFQLSDDIARYQVLVAGHTLDGRVGAVTKTIEARQPFSVDPKLPLEVSHTDTIDVPLRVTNDSDDARKVTFALTMLGLKPEGGVPEFLDREFIVGASPTPLIGAPRLWRHDPLCCPDCTCSSGNLAAASLTSAGSPRTPGPGGPRSLHCPKLGSATPIRPPLPSTSPESSNSRRLPPSPR